MTQVFSIEDDAQREEAAKFYDKEGYVLVKILDEESIIRAILEQWEEIITKQPWREKYPVLTPEQEKMMIEEPKKFVKFVTSRLPIKDRKRFKEAWTFHRGFGACCDPKNFHLKEVWKIRQDERIYKLMTKILGKKELWVDINRSIQLLPGERKSEFLHWDFNVFKYARELKKNGSSKPTNVCGKVCYNSDKFILVPGTHTDRFMLNFEDEYSEFYPDQTKPLVPINPENDPEDLIGQKIKINIPEGCAIFWDEKILHGVEANGINEPIRHGCYLGFFPAGSREKYKKISGVSEIDDRIESFEKGKIPRLWPSFARIYYFPFRFYNFPHLLQKYIDKMEPDHPQLAWRTNGKGEEVMTILPPENTDYTPPELSELGERLLGRISWN